jgi:hypothetical protein
MVLHGQPLQLKIAGDSIAGFHVDVFSNNELLVTNTEEFSIDLFNIDHSTTAHLDWKGEYWSGDEHQITLKRKSYIKAFDANFTATVTYEIINENVISKTVELFQPSMPGLLYVLKETSRPAKDPQRYVTFEYDSFPGGLVHEMYPAAGFITSQNKVVGFLTDAGYKNQYTRNTRRRFSEGGGGFVGMRKLPDAELLSVADSMDRTARPAFYLLHFWRNVRSGCWHANAFKTSDSFQKEGHVVIKSLSANFSLNGTQTQRATVDLTVPFKDQKVYTISFLCRGDVPLSLKLFRIKNGTNQLKWKMV